MSSDLFKFKFSRPEASIAKPAVSFSPSKIDNLAMSDTTFDKLRDAIYKLSGIYYADSKKYLLEGRIAKRMSILKLKSFEEYLTLISSSSLNREELNQLFIAITINETYFFRAEQQFEGFEKVIVPEIIAQMKLVGTKVFKIWSAASSSGEEAYTLAIIVKERLKPLFPNIDFQIYATDINTDVIESAKKGVYREYAVRNIPKHLLQKYFTIAGTNYTLKDEIRNMVKFSQMNLYDSYAMHTMKNFNVIFCCNVLIYFDQPSKQKVVSYLFDALSSGSCLFIGYSESLHSINKSFKLVHLDKAMVYKKS
ncbi:MAG: protein-glutamate O-methyltransferase CheR [Candidatus Kapabacteria bacterium]|nr:protein-glutamate O-methyltransferase CheR [Candidatus Kapabacteria bacterium]